jgi:hypothetical protein
MSLKNKKIFVVLTLLLISLFFISCSDHKLKLNTEELENCARWNWIALTDTKKWSKKAEAYFTYVPGKKISNNELVDEELLLCGTWCPVYISPNLCEIAEAYRNQYENADSKGNIFFCRDGTGYMENTAFSEKHNILFNYILNFEWKIDKRKIFITPLSIQEIKKEIDGTDRIIQTYNYLSKNDYYIGNMNIDNKYLIQTKNWNFSSIPTDDSFIYKKYEIKNIGVDCIRYKYTWIEDWGEPILQNYIMANEGYSLEELEAMPFYK